MAGHAATTLRDILVKSTPLSSSAVLMTADAAPAPTKPKSSKIPTVFLIFLILFYHLRFPQKFVIRFLFHLLKKHPLPFLPLPPALFHLELCRLLIPQIRSIFRDCLHSLHSADDSFDYGFSLANELIFTKVLRHI